MQYKTKKHCTECTVEVSCKLFWTRTKYNLRTLYLQLSCKIHIIIMSY